MFRDGGVFTVVEPSLDIHSSELEGIVWEHGIGASAAQNTILRDIGWLMSIVFVLYALRRMQRSVMKWLISKRSSSEPRRSAGKTRCDPCCTVPVNAKINSFSSLLDFC